MRSVLLIVCLLFSFNLSLSAKETNPLIQAAISAYEQKGFEESVSLFNKVREKNPLNPNLNYNIGNCYYRLGNLGLAKYHYLLAAKMAPRDTDIQYNLAFVNSELTDKMDKVHNPLLFRIYALLDSVSLNEMLSLWLLAITLLTGLQLVKSTRPDSEVIRQVYYVYLVIFILLSIGTITKFNYDVFDTRGVLIEKKMAVKAGPLNSLPTLFFIHEGLTCYITQTSDKWSEIRLPNGLSGWIPTESLKRVKL